ncbi:general transcription factor II-I repeat domain-containing protein 2-like [Centruroides vittatus]|uniref:general transcription factor II-I repeat domain-containing protein 2-like n=1 Tax=Centruroides vittatus TaxID=120091 RepID=UPI00350EE701
MRPEAKHKIENISLSRQTIARRIEDMNANLNEQLLNNLESAHFYAIALDESCDVKDAAQLLIFIIAITEDFQILEGLLSIVPMKDATKGEDLFREIEKCILKYNIVRKKVVNVTTDESPNMIGKNIGLIKRIEDKISEIDPNHKIIPVHCIVHQHASCKIVLKIDYVINVVVKLVNFFQSKGLKHKQFIALLGELNTSYFDVPVLYHNKIHWLSLGKVLRRVWDLQEEIKIFLTL